MREHFPDVDTMILKPEHPKLAADINSDNGMGKVCGVRLHSNLAAGKALPAAQRGRGTAAQ